VSNITEVSRPTQWKPGQSGNLNGRPVGSRSAYSAGFLRDLAEVWATHGKDTMIKTAQDQPSVFFATCARLIGPEVKLTIEQNLPGNMEEWQTMKEVIEAVRQAIPDASSKPPGAELEHVLGALQLSRPNQPFGKCLYAQFRMARVPKSGICWLFSHLAQPSFYGQLAKGGVDYVMKHFFLGSRAL
jgi:hypothetical protein